MTTCLACHSGIHSTFMHTGMGMSFDKATRRKSSAHFTSHDVIYNKQKNFYYKPFWKNDSTLCIMEFRLKGNDTIYKRVEQLKYIVGSGQHTNSHIWEVNGYLYQAPMTFYTQKGIWDMPPGFEDDNSRWSRVINVECMNCHNMYPENKITAQNKFVNVQNGIECERCHGPGELHVKGITNGEIIDTSKEIDRRIVNPKKLSRDLQMDLCQRCHMQWITVLNEGKTYFDWKPGMKLNEVMNYFIPRTSEGDGNFRMASHADRLKQSKCYKNSQMTCLTCHNPHVSVTETPQKTFDNVCTSCHNQNNRGRLPTDHTDIFLTGRSCFSCHMPFSGTSDIPHVTIHDHKISIPHALSVVGVSPNLNEEKFLGLECTTTENPSATLMAKGYLTAYDGWAKQNYLLDSAFYYLSRGRLATDHTDENNVEDWIHFYYLKNDFDNVVQQAKYLSPESTTDANTCYRIGDGYFHSYSSQVETPDFTSAIKWYERAVALMPDELEFINQLGVAYGVANQMQKSIDELKHCVSLNPKYAPALANLAFDYLTQNNLVEAEKLLTQSLALDPDYETALMNFAQLYFMKKDFPSAKKYLERVLEIDPANEKAKYALNNL